MAPSPGEWGGGCGEVPGSLELLPQEAADRSILEAIVQGPEDTQVPILLDQTQHRPQALGQAEGILPAALLPGEDGQQLQGISWRQHLSPRLLPAHL